MVDCQHRMTAGWVVMWGVFGCWLGQSVSAAEATQTERPTAVVELSSVNAAYGDLQFLFELVGHPQDFQTLKETLDLLVTGVDATRPCLMLKFARPEGLQSVNLLPVANEKDFRSFLRNLWDADMRSVPVPEATLNSQVPPAVRTKLKSLNLQPVERLMFDLWDGFARFEGGYARLSAELVNVRRPILRSEIAPRELMTLMIDGSAVASGVRRTAFEKSKEDRLAKQVRRTGESDAEFALRKSRLNLQLAAMQTVFAGAEQGEFTAGLLTAEKQGRLQGMLTPMAGGTLAEEEKVAATSLDPFAAITKSQTVLSGSFNFGMDPTMVQASQQLLHSMRTEELERIRSMGALIPANKSEDEQFLAWVIELAEAAIQQPVTHSFVRMWQDRAGAFATVGAAQIVDAGKFQSGLQKLSSVKAAQLPGSLAEVAAYRVSVHSWPRVYREFFADDGTVLIAFTQDSVWYGIGETAAERMASAIKQVGTGPAAASSIALDFSIDMQPLSPVLKQVQERRVARPKSADKKGEASEKSSTPVSPGAMASFLAGLDVAAIAVEAYQPGAATIELSVKRQDGHYVLNGSCHEGTLRFLGLTMTQFVKENLGD